MTLEVVTISELVAATVRSRSWSSMDTKFGCTVKIGNFRTKF